MSSDGALKDISEGAVKGFLNWTKEQISEFVEKVRDKDIAFINDKRTIEVVKDQRKSAEWAIYSTYVKDVKLRILIQMGLTLRKLQKEPERQQNLREKITSTYYVDGLHVAEFVQNDLNEYFGLVISNVNSPQELSSYIEEILKNIEKYVAFIQARDDPARKADEIKIRIQANLPHTFVISSHKRARSVAKQIVSFLETPIINYSFGYYEDKEKYIGVFNKIRTAEKVD